MKAHTLISLLFIVIIVISIVVVDVTVFRHKFWQRLAANIIIVLVVGALYYLLVAKHN
ncbi:MAG TPA: hypothetical protein VFN51_03815 [Candidatus Saccharimonadales bacterium]|nr:hypothetical protein [Candidatus Saccharimonadales bacterium]